MKNVVKIESARFARNLARLSRVPALVLVTAALGNASDGVQLAETSDFGVVGGSTSGNIIAFNGGSGGNGRV